MGVDDVLTAEIVGKSISLTTPRVTTRMSKNSYVLNHTNVPSLQWSFVNRIILESIHGRISKVKAAGAASTKIHEDCQKWVLNLSYMTMLPMTFIQDLVNGRTDVIVNDYYLQRWQSPLSRQVPC